MSRTYFGLRGSSLQIFIIWTVICPAYVLFGYNNSVAGGLLDLEAWIKYFPQIDTLNTAGSERSHNSTLQGAVVSLYTLGCFFGALSCVFLGDRFGRIRTIILGAIVSIIGATIQASSFSLAQLIIGRLVAGLGFGALTATAPNWQSEIAGTSHRGALVMMEGVFLGCGVAIGSWVDFGMSHATGDVAWRFPLALSAFWALLVLAVVHNLPESPRWLLKEGRVEEAKQVLSILRDVEEDSDEINFAINEMENSLAIAGESKFTDLFSNGPQRLFHRTCLAFCVQMFQQMTGVNAIAYYIQPILRQDLHLSSTKSAILSASFYMWLAVTSPLGVLTVDKFGRRKLMIYSAAGMGCCMVIVAGTLSQQSSRTVDIVSVTFIYMFNFFLGIGFLGLPFLFAAEIAPLSHRVPITALSTGSTWLWAFVVAQVTPVGLTNITWRYYIIYASINLLLILPGVFFFFPETNGRSLEEVDQIFLRSTGVLDCVKVARELPSLLPLTMESVAEQKAKLPTKGRFQPESATRAKE